MHIIVNLQPLLTPLTGIGHYTRELTLELLKRSEQQGDLTVDGLTGSRRERLTTQHPLLVNSPAGTGNGQGLEGGPAWQLARRYLRNPLTRKAYRWLYTQRLKSGGAQRHALYWEPNYILLPWRGRSVVTVHDLSHQRLPYLHPRERVAFFDRYLPESLERSTRIHVVSHFTARELQALHRVDPSRIDIVPPAVAPRFFQRPEVQEAQALRAQYQLPERYLLSVGTLEPRKNLARVLHAFASLPVHQQQETPLLLAGMPGWGEESFPPEVQDALSRGTIRRLGYVPSRDLPGLYALACGFVYVSLYEGFGMPVVEAMAAGTPVLTANATATTEVAGGAALEVEPLSIEAIRDGLQRLIDGPHEARIAAGRQRAAEYSWQRSAECLLDSFYRTFQ